MNIFCSSTTKLNFLTFGSVEKEETVKSRPELIHRPVMLEEVLEFLRPQPRGFFIDATVGMGGHAEAILKASHPGGKLLGIDQDLEALNRAADRLTPFQSRFQLVHANFSQLGEIALQRQMNRCDGILFDLGVSSLQLDLAERGFSFQKDGPLDMRMDREQSITAEEIVNYYPEKDLANILFQFGEESYSRRIARSIVKARPLGSTVQLADVVAKALPFQRARRIHPATKTFQALRIFVNDELSRLAQALKAAVELLTPGGRIVIISFHSLEDRIVKESFRSHSRDCVCPRSVATCVCGNRKILRLLTRKPLLPGVKETSENPRSRSAKFRVAEKL
jgi:16S rRNA (cytosine1402-N4)-methyltransferase